MGQFHLLAYSTVKNSDFKLQLQPVMCQPNMSRKRCIRSLVSQIVTNVGEECALRFQLLHDRQRILYGRVRWMRLVSQSIEKQYVQTFQLPHRRIRNLTMIGQVRGRSESIAVDLGLSVNHDHWRETRSK